MWYFFRFVRDVHRVYNRFFMILVLCLSCFVLLNSTLVKRRRGKKERKNAREFDELSLIGLEKKFFCFEKGLWGDWKEGIKYHQFLFYNVVCFFVCSVSKFFSSVEPRHPQTYTSSSASRWEKRKKRKSSWGGGTGSMSWIS